VSIALEITTQKPPYLSSHIKVHRATSGLLGQQQSTTLSLRAVDDE
jgi:hypothetical protein